MLPVVGTQRRHVRVEIEHARRVVDLAQAVDDRLALLQGQCLGNQLAALADQLRGAAQVAWRAPRRRCAAQPGKAACAAASARSASAAPPKAAVPMSSPVAGLWTSMRSPLDRMREFTVDQEFRVSFLLHLLLSLFQMYAATGPWSMADDSIHCFAPSAPR